MKKTFRGFNFKLAEVIFSFLLSRVVGAQVSLWESGSLVCRDFAAERRDLFCAAPPIYAWF